ncbi:MAG: hypothetical protein PHR77_02605 [Kiritimatiellae bacterium]|nr:hypothetical protein [Kiritimatiellia bacterium]MDD5523356.1 hypothetical protein [Kiritimatiellia bacterium]
MKQLKSEKRKVDFSLRIQALILFPIIILSFLLVTVSVSIGQGTSYTNWPADSEWTALINHINMCYKALIDRCIAINVPTSSVPNPSYILPLYDYKRFAEKIDQICVNFVCTTNADSNGSFDTFFSTVNTEGKYPMDFPMWTVSNLHSVAGFTNWVPDESVLNGWMNCDHGIQARITDTLNLLKFTKAQAGVVSTNKSSSDRGYWGLNGTCFGWGEASQSWTHWQTNNSSWPWALVDYATKPNGIDGASCHQSFTLSDYYHPQLFEWLQYSSITGDPLSLWPTGGISRLNWCYKIRLDIQGTCTTYEPCLDLGYCCFGVGDCYGTFSDTESFSSQAEVFVSSQTLSMDGSAYCDGWPDGYFNIKGSADLSVDEYIDAKLIAHRYISTISIPGGISSNYVSTKDLYTIGATNLPRLSWDWPETMLTNSSDYTGSFEWAPEITPLFTNKYASIYSVTDSKSDANCTPSVDTSLPYNGQSIVQKGWSINDGKWLIRWQFPSTSVMPSFPKTEDEDTDRDDIVDVGTDLASFGPDTGTIFFNVDSRNPKICVPLARTPVWYAGLPVHAYISQGAFKRLPYQWLPLPSVALPANTATLGIDELGVYQAFSLNTRILESNSISSNNVHIKRVSLMRPRGNVVVFDFPWTGTAFSPLGFPMGINSNRTYVLKDNQPYPGYSLCFASGVIHYYGDRTLRKMQRLDEYNTDSVNLGDYYNSGWLKFVTHVDGRGFDLSEDLTFDMWYDTDTTTIFPGGLLAWQYSELTMAFNTNVIMEAARDYKYEVNWQRQDGRITSVTYKPRGTSATITTTLSYDQDGRITALNKSGVDGIEKSNVSAQPEGASINYSWGTITRSQTAPAGSARTVTITENTTAGGSITRETDFDALDRMTQTRLTANGGTAQTVLSYSGNSGRYICGLQKTSKVTGILYPDSSTASFEYDSSTGWLTRETRAIGNSMDRVMEYSYTPYVGGEYVNPTNLVERPRSIVSKIGNEIVGATLFSYSGSASATIKQSTNSVPAWDDPGNLVTSCSYYVPSDWWWIVEEERDIYGGLLYSASYPGGNGTLYSICKYAESNGVLMASVTNSAGPSTVYSNNAFGNVEFSTTIENGQITSLARSMIDSFGRITRTTLIDGSYTENNNYGFFGPTSVREVDGSTSTYQYDDLGRVKCIDQPSLGKTTSYQYDSMGNITKTTITAGGKTLVTESTYDVLGRITSYKDTLGTTRYTYQSNADGTRKTTTLPTGVTIIEDRYFDGCLKEISGTGAIAHKKYEYGTESGMFYTKEINGDNANEWTITRYNMLGKPCRIVRLNNSGQPVTTTIVYDSCGRPVKKTDPNQVANLASYNAKNEVDKSGLHIDGAADALTPSSNDRFNTFHRTVDAAGIKNETSVYPMPNDANPVLLSSSLFSLDGRTNTSVFAGRGSTSIRNDYQEGGTYSVTTTNSDGTKVVSDYIKWRLDTVTRKDKNNAVIDSDHYEYDGLGGLVRATNSKRGTTEYVINSQTRLVEKVIPSDTTKGEITYAYYPGTDRMKYMRRSDGLFMRYDYYDNGLLQRIYDGPSYDTQYEYDSQGRQTRMTTWRDGRAVTTEWQYNGNSGLLEQKKLFGLAGPVATYQYRDNGQLASFTDAESVRTDYSYNNAGDRVSAVTSDGSSAIISTFNRLGRISSSAISNGISETFAYALDGSLLTNSITGNSIVSNAVFTYSYAPDHPGLINMNYNVSGCTSGSVGITYDAAVRISTITNGAITVTYGYPADAMVVTSIIWKLGGTNIMARYIGWDFKNMRVTNGIYVVNGSNMAGSAYSYVANDDRISKITSLMDGSWWSYEYDSMNQLKSGRKYFADGSAVFGRQFAYEYDSIGNTVKGGPLSSRERPVNTFQADDLNFHVSRIWSNKIEVTGTASTNATVTVNDVMTTRQGERFSAVVPVNTTNSSAETNITVYAIWYNGTNDIVASVTGKVFLAKSVEPVSHRLTGEISQDSRFTNQWNKFGQLVSVTSTNANPNFKLEFLYYPDGRRASKKVYTWNSGAWMLNTEYSFVYDSWNLVSESISDYSVSPALRLTKSYSWGLDLSGLRSGSLGGPGAPRAGGIGGLLSITVTSNGTSNTYFPISDHNGNISHIVDSTGTVVARYEYSPFGVLIGECYSCPLVRQNLGDGGFRFQSKYYDKETELYYFGYRYYDPNSCKWLSRDPKGENGGINLTCFCLNDPINSYDPDGLAAYFFGGTGNSLKPEGISNVEILHNSWDEGKYGFRHYMPGVYSGFTPGGKRNNLARRVSGEVLLEGVAGKTLGDRVDKMMDTLEDELKAGDKEVNVFGFSRGSASALEFLNRIQDRKTNPKTASLYNGIRINFVVLWDTVRSTWKNYRTELPVGLHFEHQPLHFISIDEQRRPFSDEEVLDVHGALQIGYRGVHADDGNGYPENGPSPFGGISLGDAVLAGKFIGIEFDKTELAKYPSVINFKATPTDNSSLIYGPLGHRKFPHGMILDGSVRQFGWYSKPLNDISGFNTYTSHEMWLKWAGIWDKIK